MTHKMPSFWQNHQSCLLYTSKKTEEVIGIEGVSIPHGFAAASAPLFMLLDKIYDKIPFFDFKDEDEFEEEKDNKLFSLISTVFGDPLFLGLLMLSLIHI